MCNVSELAAKRDSVNESKQCRTVKHTNKIKNIEYILIEY